MKRKQIGWLYREVPEPGFNPLWRVLLGHSSRPTFSQTSYNPMALVEAVEEKLGHRVALEETLGPQLGYRVLGKEEPEEARKSGSASRGGFDHAPECNWLKAVGLPCNCPAGS
jgi:hypothetical protein